MNEMEEYEAKMESDWMLPRTSKERFGCLFLLLWGMWSVLCGILKIAEIVGAICCGS
jgi:hypothetical protein